jgi:hypothetical protein
VNQSIIAQPCNQQNVAGGDEPDSRTIQLGRRSGTFQFQYDTAGIPDRLLVSYEGRQIFDSTCVGTDGTRTHTITYSGTASTVTVQVIPNCAGDTSGTFWTYLIVCPN